MKSEYIIMKSGPMKIMGSRSLNRCNITGISVDVWSEYHQESESPEKIQ